MPHIQKILKAAIAAFCMISVLLISDYDTITAYASSGYQYVLLDTYSKTLRIGDEFYLLAITSTGKKPTFSSDNSAVASVNTYGKVKAKKAGTATITAKIKNGEASCRIKVQKTEIILSAKSITMENGETAKLKASVSNGHSVTYKSAKPSIASVTENGVILAKKPGTTAITVTADKTSVSCKVTVKKPKLRLNKTKVSLYRRRKVKLSVVSASKSTPKWKSSKKSVAVVDDNGTVTAVKHGTAEISVTVDGVSKTCEVTVEKPDICFSREEVELSVGQYYQAQVTVSSGNWPEFSSSNTNVASVDKNGRIHAKSKGRAYIYAKEDGAKERMTVIVSEK